MHLKRRVALAALALCASPAAALVEVQFGDGVPWDVFIISAINCPITDAELVIDLRSSVAGVIADTTYGGPGFQDPLPPELFEGDAALGHVPDGVQLLPTTIQLLDRDTPIGLRLDVDDTVGRINESRISVAQSEIAGAVVRLTVDGETTEGTFDNSGLAALPLPSTVADCNLLF